MPAHIPGKAQAIWRMLGAAGSVEAVLCVLAIRDQVATQRGYDRPIRCGAAGGIGTPRAVAAAFGMGAAGAHQIFA